MYSLHVVVEYGSLFLLGWDEGVAFVERLDAGDDDTYQKGKFENAFCSTQEAVDPARQMAMGMEMILISISFAGIINSVTNSNSLRHCFFLRSANFDSERSEEFRKVSCNVLREILREAHDDRIRIILLTKVEVVIVFMY